MSASLILAALEHVWRTLVPLHRPMAVLGGLAVAAWGHLRATRDVDLLIGIDQAALPLLLDRLAAAGIHPMHRPPVLTLGSLRLVQVLYQPPGAFVDVQIDLLLAESVYHQTALSRRVATELPGCNDLSGEKSFDNQRPYIDFRGHIAVRPRSFPASHLDLPTNL